jgi:hypothetical protein
MEHHDTTPSANIFAHLKQELIHGALWLIMGGTFANTQNNGQITKCRDNIWQWWFPRLILHSAGYKEK